MSLSYISSARKKSCKNCVKAKRRCDLGYPYCKRCFGKGLTCTYPSASRVREAEEVVVRLRTPDLVPLANDVVVVVGTTEVDPDAASIHPSLLHCSDSSASPESVDDEPYPRWVTQPSRICEAMLPQMWEHPILTEGQITAVTRRLCEFLPSLVYSGSTPCLHESLYVDWQPAAYQDSISVAALYLAKTRKNVAILRNTIDSKIAALIAASATWSLREHFAAVQALMVYQIIRLFDAELGLQNHGAKDNRLLEVWVAHLWKRFFLEPQKFKSSFDSWVFEESLRRTVLMSVFVRGMWHGILNGGWCDQVQVLSKLPIASNPRLWDYDEDEWTMNETWSRNEKSKITTYKEFSWSWMPDNDLDQLTEWQKLLLVACRGQDDPRLLRC